ncbi:MAG: response regulator [Spirochaetota bacterium]
MNKHTLLLVDDDENVLKSLQRLFRQEKDIQVFTAEDAPSAVARLKKSPVDLLISDERMPQIEGHKLVQYVKQNYPGVIRIILTGYADTEAMRAAVNRGEVYRYLFKPWDDNELLVTVRNALQLAAAERKKQEYARELEAMNKRLEEKVQQRTRDLEKALKIISAQRDSNRKQLMGTAHFLDSIRALIDKQSRSSHLALRIRRMIAKIGEQLKLPAEEQKTAELCAYFYRIGSLAEKNQTAAELYAAEPNLQNEDLLKKSADLITSVLNYPELGDAILYSTENYDGSGGPEGRVGDAIPLASRLFRIAYDFEDIQVRRKCSQKTAADFIFQHKDRLYEPRMAQALYENFQTDSSAPLLRISVDELREGMVLAEDIYLDNGVLYLAADTKMTVEIYKRLQNVSFDRLFTLNNSKKVTVRKRIK